MKKLLYIFYAISVCIILTSCSNKSTGLISDTKYAFDTFIKITLYDTDDRDILDECFSLCDLYEDIFSADKEGSELFELNRNISLATDRGYDLTGYEISKDLYTLINKAYSYKDVSSGKYNIAERSVFELWDFHAEEAKAPTKESINNAILQSGNTVFSLYTDASDRYYIDVSASEPALFDLGSCAKGYIADRLKEKLIQRGVRSGVIDLGGNILCLGQKELMQSFGRSLHEDFRIGISMPYSNTDSLAYTLSINDLSVVTSGIYQRYFINDGIMYHHILDATTGYPAQNSLASVSVIGKESAECDILSTLFFLIGEENAMKVLDGRKDIYTVFLYTDGSASYSDNFEKLLIN